MTKKQFRQLFIVNLFVLFITYSTMLFMHFSIDSYGIIFDIDKNTPLGSGRLIFYLFFLLCQKVGINPVINQIGLIAGFILLSAVVSTGLVKMIISYYVSFNKLQLLIVELSVLIGFVNVFYLEWFLFPEVSLVYGLAIVLLYFSIEYTFKKGNKSYIFSIVFLILALNSYQAIFSIYIMITLLVVLLKNNFRYSLETLKNTLKVFLIAGCSAILQFIELKILQFFSLNRSEFMITGESQKFLLNILDIISQQFNLWWDAFNFLPQMILLVTLTIMVVLIIVGFHYAKLNILDSIFIVIIFFGCYVSIFVLGIFNATVWLAPRTIVSFFFFFSIMIVSVSFLFKFNVKIEKFICVILVIFLLTNFMKIQSISINHYASLTLNRQHAELIQQKIDEYEINTGKEISNIAIRNDVNPTWGYSGIKYNKFDTNMRAFVVLWAAVPCLNYYTGNYYSQVEFPDEIFLQFGNGCDWSELNLEEQMIFIDKTAYLVNY